MLTTLHTSSIFHKKLTKNYSYISFYCIQCIELKFTKEELLEESVWKCSIIMEDLYKKLTKSKHIQCLGVVLIILKFT